MMGYKIRLALQIRENKKLLFGKCDLACGISKRSKSEKWEEIYRDLVSFGAPVKSVHHVRKVSVFKPCRFRPL
jgi:hypothetical protein